DCYEFLDLSDVDDGVKDALASTLNTTTQQPGGGIPAAAAAGGGKPKQQQQYHSYRPRRRQSNASSVMSSSDGSGVYDYPPSSAAAAATFPYPLEYHQPSQQQQQSPQNHPPPQQQHHQHYFPYAAATTAIVAPYEDGGVTDRSTGSGGGPPSRYHYQKRQKDGGGNSRPPYQQYQQHYQHHHHYNQSWSPPAAAAAAASSSSASSSSTAASTATATTLPNTSANGNVETTYYNTTTTTASKTADYGETGSGDQPPHHHQSHHQQHYYGSYRVGPSGRSYRRRSETYGSVAPQQQPIYPSQPIPAGYMVGGPHANTAMYPMQVIPQPGNVYVSNLTANVNVHGFMPHGMPGYMAAATTGTPSGPAGAAYIASEVPGHEMQQVMTPRDGRTAAMRRNGTGGSNGSTSGRNGSRLGSTPRPARNYVPHHLQQQQQQPAVSQPVIIQAPMAQPAQSQSQQSAGGQQQPQQSQTPQQSQQQQQQQGQSQPQTPDIVQQAPQQQQHPAMAMEPQQMPYGYSGGYYNYIPMQFYQPVPMGHHPSAQHATGAPIFQVPMYSAAPMYGYPGVMYPTIYQPEYPMYDDKGDEQNPQPSPEEGGVMHQGLWQPPTMIEYNPESGEYIQHEDDEGAMLPPGPPQMQPIAHVLDPNVPNFTMQMGPPTPIPDDEYAPSEEYNANTMMSPAPSSRASSHQNLTQNEMYLVPQQQQPQEPQHLHQHQQTHQHMQMMDLEEVAMHEQAMDDHEGNYLIEEEEEEVQSYEQEEQPPMSPSPPPPPQQQQQHIHVQSPHEMVYNPEPIQQQMVVVEQPPALPIQEPPQSEVTQVCEPEPPVRDPTPPPPEPPMSAALDKPPPPIPFEILKHQHEQQLQKQQQQQQQQQQQTQSQYNDTNNNNQKKKTNEVALAATPAASVEPQPAKESASKPAPSQTQQTSFKSQTSDELAKLTRAVQEKFVLNDDRGKSSFRWANPNAPVATTTIASFTSPTTTVVTGQPMQKKTTASVSVSAIPNKEYTPATSTSAVKPYQKNTSPIPFTALGSTATPLAAMQHKQPLAPQKSYTDSSVGVVATAPTMESKKVEAIPHREPPHHIQPPPGPPPLLSVPPPVIPAPSYAPPPPAATPAVAAPAKSWASLFNSSSSSSSASAPAPAPTAAPSLAPSTAITAGPPPSSTSAHPALPTHSPFAASFMPALARSGSGHTPAEAASIPSKKPIAKVLPFDKSGASASMSYSAAANQSTSTQPKPNKPNQPQQQHQQQQHLGKVPDQLDENTLKLGEFLNTYQIENNSISIQPRGLINRSNYCYINAILQALVACPPFYHLMRAIRSLPAARNSKHPKPFIDAMTALVAEFSTLPLRSKVARDKTKKDETPDITTDTPLEPVVIHKILALLRSDIFQVEGRQEDAEEFLGCVLNRLNDEMLELMKLSKNESEVNGSSGNSSAEESGDGHGDDQDDWKVIRGNRNKGTITRTTDFGRSPMSDIFGGKLRSRVHREGDHPTDNIQPFFTLQLDIEKAASVKDALDLLVGKDQLEGMTCSKTKQEIQAWQQVTLEELPIVMILHLKCFDYKMDGCTKILKTLEFPIELKIDSKLMSSKGKAYTAKQKQYKLFAVVYHDGKEASKGHYITDVFHAGYGTWIRYDDSTVRAVPEFNVLHPKAPRVPYLLYYRRLDTHYHGGGGAGAGAGAPAGGAPAGSTGSTSNSSNISSSNNNSNSNNSSSSANSSTNYSSGGGSYYGGGPGPK
ncbi:hypothetical protein pipiens_007969, partial [Culex pipiens pipiens]